MSNINKTLFISESTLKENSVLQDNVDMKSVTPSIQWSQDAIIQPLLGTKLYRELQRQVHDNDLKPKYKTLLDDYIEPLIIYAVLGEVPDNLLLKLMNLTVGTSSDEQMTSATLKNVAYLKEQNKNKMKFYAKRLDDYLNWNRSDYPEFMENTEDDIRPTGRPYTSQIAMPRRHGGGKVPLRVKYNDVVYDIINKRWQ